MRFSHKLFIATYLAGVASCAPFSAGGGASVPVSMEERTNGYVLNIPSAGRSVDIGAFVTGGHWVIVTIADPEFPELSVEAVPPAVVDSFEVSRFPSATQISLHFPELLRGVEAVPSSDREYLQIAVFVQDPKGRRRD